MCYVYTLWTKNLETWNKCNQQSTDINTCYMDLCTPNFGKDKYVSRDKKTKNYYYKRDIL